MEINMNIERKKVLLIQPLYDIIVCFGISICGVIILFLPMILSWKTDLLPTQIIYYIISGVFIIGGLVGALRFMEYAIVSDSGIVIKNPFGTIAFINWQSVVSIYLETGAEFS
ncbi:MAG: hypothetical protein ACI3XQ_04635 [Eubacteriales bacterium]